MDVDGILDIDDLSPDLIDPGEVRDRQAAPPLLEYDSPDLIGKPLRDIERWAIEQTLKLTNGNREETASILGISERNLYRKLNEYQLR
jgi:two-component system response regulator HydG